MKILFSDISTVLVNTKYIKLDIGNELCLRVTFVNVSEICIQNQFANFTLDPR